MVHIQKTTNLFNKIQNRLKTITAIELLITISALSLTVLLVKFFGLKREWHTIQVEVISKNWSENYNPYGYRTPFWLSDKIKVGQIERNNSGREIAKVTRVEKYIRGLEENEVYLIVDVEAIYQKRQNKYTFKNKGLDLGSAIELNLDNIQVFGQIIDNNYPQNGYPSKTVVVTARGKNFEPWTISQAVPGSKMYNLANNEVIAEIITATSEPASGQPLKIENDRLVNYSNRQKDLVITAKVKVFQQANRWYFAGHQNIISGGNLYLYTPTVNLYSLEIENVQGL
jgi:hypothetical protein